MAKEFSCLLISDFNIDVLKGYLSNDEHSPGIKALTAPYGQVRSVLLDPLAECWTDKCDVAIIWTQPESAISSFQQFLNSENITIENILKDVDEFADMVLGIAGRVDYVLVPSWVSWTGHKGIQALSMKHSQSVSSVLTQMNNRLSERISHAHNFHFINTDKWIAAAGKNAFSPKLWYMAKVPYGQDVFAEATHDIKTVLRSVAGLSRKIIILDLDDTLWGGLVGEVGWKNIVLGGHDPIGEAFVDFQKELKSYRNRGILLGIVSKNDESAALDAITNHPEMVLRQKDFSGCKINWDDKVKNITELVASLNLGLESVVFIDDNPVERSRVREALPQVLVPDWPDDKMFYKSALMNLDCFDPVVISEEDRTRAHMYQVDAERQDLKLKVRSVEEWLSTLDTKVIAEELNEVNVARTAQLLNKTNQINLTTRRMSENEIMVWAKEGQHKVWTFRVADKFSNLGLVGIISLELKNDIGYIRDFVLSCRVMGRKIEESMIHVLINHARGKKVKKIIAQYIPTERNGPCLKFWQESSGFEYVPHDNQFIWKMENMYPKPGAISLETFEHNRI